ncbi:MAG: hypothetical protein AMS14_03370 [Planctomycetes bacterium DG_20]|nr:MAG: hypothetical protein AMS14_03370 [Planctomycetes bacterium DG_20]
MAISIEQAVLLALTNNQELAVERLNPEIARTAEQEERGVFDPLLTGTFGKLYDKGERVSAQGWKYDYTEDSLVGEAGLTNFFPTGTSVTLGASTAMVDRAIDRVSVAGNLEQLIQSRVGLTVSQALLRGAGRAANLAAVRGARIESQMSEYELRGFAEGLVALVEETYWTCRVAKRHVEIFTQAVQVAQDRVAATEERIAAGTLGETERVAAKAAVAQRQEDLIDAKSEYEKARLLLLRLLNLPGGNLWTRTLDLVDWPKVPSGPLEDVEVYVEKALRMRPDLNEARLAVQRGDLEVVKTRNGLLPQLDLFVTWGKSGYAESFSESWHRLGGGRYDMLFGVRAEVPLGNQSARAQHKRARVTRQQAEQAVKNMEQLVQWDVRTAYVEVQRATDQIEAAKAARDFFEEVWRAEEIKLSLGRSTNLQVARADRDRVRSHVAVAEAAADYLRALVNLRRFAGSLLDDRGVEAPGAEPVELTSVGP